MLKAGRTTCRRFLAYRRSSSKRRFATFSWQRNAQWCSSGDDEELREVLQTLTDLRPALESMHVTCQVVEVAVLQALALAKQGHHAQAHEALRDAVALAMPGGWIRPFAELGRPMAELLERLRGKGLEGDFIDRLLASCETAPAPVEAVPAAAASEAPCGPEENGLTNREIDILELLSQRLQNKEIAAKLYISTHTVNDHLKHIYQKLGVSSRRQAVTKARDTGILPTP